MEERGGVFRSVKVVDDDEEILEKGVAYYNLKIRGRVLNLEASSYRCPSKRPLCPTVC